MGRSKRKASGSEDIIKAKKSFRVSHDADVLHDTSVFGELVTKAGIVLKPGKKPNEISKDHAVFQRDLGLSVKRHPDFPQVVEEFTEALTKHIEDQLRFFQSMMPTKSILDSDASCRGATQESLMRLLLGVEYLQPSIMNMLLEKLAEFTGDEEPIMDQNERVNMPRLIMGQFRWLDRIVNSQEVTQKMLDIVSIVQLEAQREIITCIPEVVDDSEHGMVAKELRDLFMDNNQLVVPILDALSNLNLRPELLTEIRSSVVESLPSVKLADLPIIVKFLLQSVSKTDAQQVITELRAHLDFNSTSSSTSQKAQAESRSPSDLKRDSGCEGLILDAIRSGIRFQKSIAEAWVKAIESVKTVAEHKVVDLFVLFILHSNSHKKPVESLFRNKIRAGHFTEVLLQATFGSHGEVLSDYFASILALAEVLLRSPEPLIGYFASAMYKQAFMAFDTYCQQEIVGNLVTHIGSGFAGEVDTSLDILNDLVESEVSQMAPFAIFIKGVLDYLDNLEMAQIKKLYSMLSTLAFRNPGSSEGLIQDDMHIIIRKQLSNNNTKYKRMGVIGAIMVVKSMAFNSSSDQSTQACQTSSSIGGSLPEDVYKQVIALLQLVRASSSRNPEAAALFMDELSNTIQRGIIDPKVETWVGENVISDFQDDYVMDVEPDSAPQDAILPVALKYGLDEEGSIAINLLPLLAKALEDRRRNPSGSSQQEKRVSPLCLAPNFRLLQICEGRQHEGDLEEIDALLGCAVVVPQPEIYEKLDSLSPKEKNILCESLFLVINWFREVVNAFASQTDPEMKGKVITRLNNITELQKHLETCLAAHGSFKPPPANFDCEERSKALPGVVAPSTSAGGGAKRGRKPGAKGKKKSRSDKDEEDDDDDEEDSRDSSRIEMDTQQDKGKDGEAEKIVVDLNQYRQYFRELDLKVFTILKAGLITKAALDTEMNTEATTTLQLQPPQLKFLLEDLVQKLHHALIASASKRRTFLKTRNDKNSGFSHLAEISPSKVARYMVKLLPSLCEHLEGTSVFFQTLLAASDGMVDGPGFHTEEALMISSCFQLLLQTLLALFSWTGFLMTQHRSLLKQALGVLAARLNAAASLTQTSFPELVKQSFNYLENFSSTAPSIAAAVTLSKILVAISERSDSNQMGTKIATLTQGFLKRDWFGEDGQREKGAKHNELLQQLLKLHMSHTDDVLSTLENLAAVGIKELMETDKNGYSNTFPTLTKGSYPVFYRVMLSELVDSVKIMDAGKQTDDTEVKVEKLLRWNLGVRIFHILVNLVKGFDGRGNLGAVLKYGRQFVDVFLRQGMPLLDHMFRAHKEDVQGLLKNLQVSTRALHHLCGHSKIMKDISLTNQVPPMKKCLEAFVYRVKAMLTVNKCLEAFWLGNLKNRDLQGEEILSQSTVADTTAEESDNDSLPEDDDDDSEVEMDKESEASNEAPNPDKNGRSDSDGEESYSETF